MDGMLFDLGVSSPSWMTAPGASLLMADAPLDMRMDRDQGLSAADVVNGWSQEELRRILTQYGEERYAASIAASIVRRRADKPIETTLELVDVIRSGMPARALKRNSIRLSGAFRPSASPSTTSWPAWTGWSSRPSPAEPGRTAGGDHLPLPGGPDRQDRLGRVCPGGCTCPPDFPVCVCGKTPDVRLVSRKPILPSGGRWREPRARSAKLRVAEKLKDPDVRYKAPGQPERRDNEENGVSGMASRHRSNSTYRTYGSVAYAPAYDGSAVRAPGRGVHPPAEAQGPSPHSKRTLTRTRGTGAGRRGGLSLRGDRLCRGGRLCRPADVQLCPVRGSQ